jgi:hypothetical protein
MKFQKRKKKNKVISDKEIELDSTIDNKNNQLIIFKKILTN